MRENHPLVLVSSFAEYINRADSVANGYTDFLCSYPVGVRNYVCTRCVATTWNDTSTLRSSGDNTAIYVLVRCCRLQVLRHAFKSPGRVEAVPI